jgi:putative transcriptional regulator
LLAISDESLAMAFETRELREIVKGNKLVEKIQSESNVDAVNGGDTLLTVHRIASGLFRSGTFDKATMRKFDELCLTPIEQMNAEDIKGLREKSGVSQAVFARILNVTTSTVGQWERGDKKPTGSALKLLSLMRSRGVGAVL